MTKGEIRKYYLTLRSKLSEEELKNRSNSIANQFFSEFDLSTIPYLHVFVPIKKFNEVNTWLILEKIWKEYPHVKTVTSITRKEALEHYIIDKNTIFINDKWGIPIPQKAEQISAEIIDLVLTPLLAFDEKLNRVGYGKGYYDKFFAECKPDVVKVGVSLFPQLDENITDTNEFDIALDKVISNS